MVATPEQTPTPVNKDINQTQMYKNKKQQEKTFSVMVCIKKIPMFARIYNIQNTYIHLKHKLVLTLP